MDVESFHNRFPSRSRLSFNLSLAKTYYSRNRLAPLAISDKYRYRYVAEAEEQKSRERHGVDVDTSETKNDGIALLALKIASMCCTSSTLPSTASVFLSYCTCTLL